MSAVLRDEPITLGELARWSLTRDGAAAKIVEAYRPAAEGDPNSIECKRCHQRFDRDTFALHLIRSGHGVSNAHDLARLRREAIYELVASGRCTTARAASQVLGLDMGLVVYHLAALRKANRVKMLGSASSTHYEVVAPDAAKPASVEDAAPNNRVTITTPGNGMGAQLFVAPVSPTPAILMPNPAPLAAGNPTSPASVQAAPSPQEGKLELPGMRLYIEVTADEPEEYRGMIADLLRIASQEYGSKYYRDHTPAPAHDMKFIGSPHD